MSVNIQELFDDIAAEIGSGASNKVFTAKFVRAVNRSLDTLSLRANLETRLGHIAQINTTYTELDDEYNYILFTGVRYFLPRMGQRPGDPRVAKAVLEDTDGAWESAIGDFISARSYTLQDTSTNDIAGWGDVS